MQLDFLETANMVGMAVSYDEVANRCNRHADVVQCLRKLCAAVYREVMFALDDQKIVLVQGFSESRTGAQEVEFQFTLIGKF